MPRGGAIIFSNLIGKLDVFRVSCEKCGRDGCLSPPVFCCCAGNMKWLSASRLALAQQ